MEELLEKYSKECSFISKLSFGLWRISLIIILITIFVCIGIYEIIFIPIIVISIYIFVVLFICDYIELKDIVRKLKIKENISSIIFNRNKKRQIYAKMDCYQKDWITCYCKKHKINLVSKLAIIKEELNTKKLDNIVKYLNPAIIGAMVLVVWDNVFLEIYEDFNFEKALNVTIIVSIIISALIGWLKKNYKMYCQFIKTYSKYFGYDRLNELLVYQMLKCKK